MALEAIYFLLTGKVFPWATIMKRIVADDFVQLVLTINIKKIKPSIIAKFKKDYVKSKEWDLEKLKKASKAMGPLGEWLESLTFLVN